MDARHTPESSREAPADPAVAEERRLWQIISDSHAQPVDRLKAYVRWLETGGPSGQHGASPETPSVPDSQPRRRANPCGASAGTTPRGPAIPRQGASSAPADGRMRAGSRPAA